MSRVEAVKMVLALADSAHGDDLVALAILGALGEVERGTFAVRGVAAIRSLRAPEASVVVTDGGTDDGVVNGDTYKNFAYLANRTASDPVGTATATADATTPGPGTFSCPDCDKTVTTAQALGVHRFRAHGTRKPRPGEDRVNTGSAPVPTSGLHLYCHCGDRFDHHDQKGLAKHVWSVHRGYPTALEQKPRSAES